MRYNPKQAELLRIFKRKVLKRINFLVGAVRSGKTWISLVLWAFWILTQPQDGTYLMVAKTLTSLKRNCLDLLETLVGRANFSYSISQKQGVLFGRRVYLEGVNDARAESKIRGMTLHGAYCDELTLFSEDFFAMLLSRLSEPGAKLFATTNPDNPLHWVKANYIDRQDKLDLFVMDFLIDDNTFLDPEYVQQLKREYKGSGNVFYRRYINGEWCLAEGLIYSSFDADRHVNANVPKLHNISVSIDVGQSNATVFLATGEGVDNRLYCLKEYYHSGKKTGTTKSPLTYAKDFEKWLITLLEDYPGMVIDDIWIDPSALGFKAQLRDMGFSARSANNDVIPGIQTVSSMIDADLLRVHPSCKNLIKEFHSYSWDDKAAKRGEDKPIKENDHACDALRYRIHSCKHDWVGRKPIENSR